MRRSAASAYRVVLLAGAAMTLSTPAHARVQQGEDSQSPSSVQRSNSPETMPIDPETGRPFPTLAEVAARASRLREMTAKEASEYENYFPLAFPMEPNVPAPTRIAALRKLLAIEEATFGSDHPELLATLVTLESNLRLEDRFDDAALIGMRALTLSQKLLGPRHPDTLKSVNNYAISIFELGDTARAEPLFEMTFRIRREVFGERDIRTISSQKNYASALQALGRAQKAEPLFSEALRLQREMLDKGDLRLLDSLDKYAGVLIALGRTAEAKAFSLEAYQHSRFFFGRS